MNKKTKGGRVGVEVVISKVSRPHCFQSFRHQFSSQGGDIIHSNISDSNIRGGYNQAPGHLKNENTDDHIRTKTDRRLYEETKKRTLNQMNKQTNIVIKLFAVKTNKPNNNQMTDQTEDSTINRPTDRTNKLQTDRKNERTDRPYGQTTDRPTDHTNDGAERMNNGRTVRTNEGKNRDTN